LLSYCQNHILDAITQNTAQQQKRVYGSLTQINGCFLLTNGYFIWNLNLYFVILSPN